MSLTFGREIEKEGSKDWPVVDCFGAPSFVYFDSSFTADTCMHIAATRLYLAFQPK